MSDGQKMDCPDCGVEMNHHADKLDYGIEAPDNPAYDPELGGVLEQFHTCPDCGTTRTRPAG